MNAAAFSASSRASIRFPPVQSSSPASLREQIAAVAARMIAEDGLDYAGAKRRAVREVIGEQRRSDHEWMPDNAEVEAAVREHQALFMADTQPARLLLLRCVARDVMRFLVEHGPGVEPFVNGAIVNGTAGEHSDIHLQVFNDNAKDIEIFLLNAGLEFEVSEGNGPRDGGEVLSFLWPQRLNGRPTRSFDVDQEAVHLAVLDPRDRRPSPTGARADLRGLEALIDHGDEDTR